MSPGGLRGWGRVVYSGQMPPARPPEPSPTSHPQRWGFAGGEEHAGTPEQVVRGLQLRSFGAPGGTGAPLLAFCEWMAGRVGGKLGPECDTDELGAIALLALLEARGVAWRLEAQVVSLADARAAAAARRRR